ncbi:MAG: hypothetical protein ACREQ2_27870 [Candidatus Binatia bacterium]
MAALIASSATAAQSRPIPRVDRKRDPQRCEERPQDGEVAAVGNHPVTPPESPSRRIIAC